MLENVFLNQARYPCVLPFNYINPKVYNYLYNKIPDMENLLHSINFS